MTVANTTREQVLDRIRKATSSVATGPSQLNEQYTAIPRPYVRKGALHGAAKQALLMERLRDYEAEVAESTQDNLGQAIGSMLAARDAGVLAVPGGVPPAWKIPQVDWRIDQGLSNAEIEKVDGVLTGAFCAIADSGTIVLHHTSCEGRRALTLLPDWHLCILFASQVVETLPEYFERARPAPKLVTWISGPSATADIEMTRIKGVHGPRQLSVILVNDEE